VQAFVGRGDERVRAPRLALDPDVRDACIQITRTALERLARLGVSTSSSTFNGKQSSERS
jgi:hypothetical protein